MNRKQKYVEFVFRIFIGSNSGSIRLHNIALFLRSLSDTNCICRHLNRQIIMCNYFMKLHDVCLFIIVIFCIFNSNCDFFPFVQICYYVFRCCSFVCLKSYLFVLFTFQMFTIVLCSEVKIF